MAVTKLVGGSFSSMYIGQAAASSTPLTHVNQLGTGGYRCRYSVPKGRFIKAVNAYVQDALCTLAVNLAFISDDPNGVRLAMSNWLNAAHDDTPPSGQQYSLFLYDAINDGSSLYIPICETVTDLSFLRDKKSQMDIPLTFRWSDPNSNVELFYKRTNAELKTIMGGQWPLA